MVDRGAAGGEFWRPYGLRSAKRMAGRCSEEFDGVFTNVISQSLTFGLGYDRSFGHRKDWVELSAAAWVEPTNDASCDQYGLELDYVIRLTPV